MGLERVDNKSIYNTESIIAKWNGNEMCLKLGTSRKMVIKQQTECVKIGLTRTIHSKV